MGSFSVGTSLLNYLNAQTKASTDSSTGAGTSNVSSSAQAKVRLAATTQAALQSAPIQQSAAISQAARQAGSSGAVMSLYTSLLQQSIVTPAVFSVSAGSSSMTYPGSLTTKA